MSVSETTAARPTPPMPSQRLVDGPSAWVGADMKRRAAEWSYRLSPAEIAEIEGALRAVQERGLDIADIRRGDFPLPTLGPVLDRLRTEVLNGRGFVLLRGVPVEDRPIAESAAAYWGLGTYFGSARSQNAKGHLLGHVYDLGIGLSETDPNLRSYATAERQDGRAFDNRQLDDLAQCDGGAAARSLGAPLPAVPCRSPWRSAGRQS